MKYGWPISYDADKPPEASYDNHNSAKRHQKHVDVFIKKELVLKAMLGPFKNPPFIPWCQISPMLTREKKESENRRVIIDLSWPEGKSVNAGILKNTFEGQVFNYGLPTVSNFTDILLSLGPGSYMWKADLKSAYRQLRIDPYSYPLLGVTNNGLFYLDICPSFGCRQSGGCQQRVSNAAVYIMSKLFGAKMLVYVDDFACISATYEESKYLFDEFNKLCKHLGLELAEEKSVPPTQNLEWLGFDVNSESKAVFVPPKKLSEIICECQKWVGKDAASRKEIQSIAGRLNHISQVIKPARKFMARIFEQLRNTPDTGSFKLSNDFKLDIRWFIDCAAEMNCRRLIMPNYPNLTIECDACLQGAGGYCETTNEFYSFPYPRDYAEQTHINQLEAINGVIAIKTFTRNLDTPHRVIVYTDNSASMYSLNSGRTRDPLLAACAREVALISAKNQHEITFVHTPGSELILVDSLSREYHQNKARTIANQMCKDKNLLRVKPFALKYVMTPM